MAAGGGGGGTVQWKALLQRALEANAHVKHSVYFQLATVGAGGRPSNRTVVFRGFHEGSERIQINTDLRSSKVQEIRLCPFAEICWYFTESWEQFRIRGTIDLIDGTNPDSSKIQQRERSWFARSLGSRLPYIGPHPGLPLLDDDDDHQEITLDPSAGPVDAFCLLVLDPEEVDYLNLKSNQRLNYVPTQGDDGAKTWTARKLNP